MLHMAAVLMVWSLLGSPHNSQAASNFYSFVSTFITSATVDVFEKVIKQWVVHVQCFPLYQTVSSTPLPNN
jgi:hypothetical protein